MFSFKSTAAIEVSGTFTVADIEELLTSIMGRSYNKPLRTFEGTLKLSLTEVPAQLEMEAGE